jgi:dTDP-4-amino-4,6-dideoxygalactose transaminase
MAMLSFHATKLFTTGEGGALVCRDADLLQRVRFFKNFGIADEETVIGPGINGKMSELQAAFGLLQLGGVDNEIARRGAVAEVYRSGLDGIPGIRIPSETPETQHNYAYFPILVDPERHAVHRDQLYTLLRECNVITRKYFHPLCSHIPCYAGLPSAAPANLPVAEDVAQRILCLPIYGALDLKDAARICEIIRGLHETTRAEKA